MATTWSYVRPDKGLESPFSAKHLHRHQPFLRPNYSIAVDELGELYQFTTQETSQQFLRQLWVSSKVPFGHIRLELRTIQGSVANERCLGMDCFNIAVKNMATEDAENFQNTKCKGWRHYVYPICVMNDNSGAEHSGAQLIPNHKFACESTDYDTYGSHLVLIPVLHAAHWTLYAFDMCGRKLSILDCSSSPHPEVRNEEIRLQICSALNQTMRSPSDKSKNDFTCWKFQYPDVPSQQNREDSGFIVFNFMRLWDGHRLHMSFKTEESRELRMEFLAYLLSCKENGATLPKDVLSWISNISDGRKKSRKNRQPWALYPMNRQLWEDAMKGELVVEENAGTATSQAQLRGEADENSGSNAGAIRRLRSGATSEANRDPHTAGTSTEAIGNSGSNAGAIRQPYSGATSEANGEPQTAGTSTEAIGNSESNAYVLPKRFRGVTPEGDGVLHIAARYGHVGLVRTVCSIAGVPIELETQPVDSNSQPVTQPADSTSQPVTQLADSTSQPVTQPADSASVSSSQPVTQPADPALVSSSQPIIQLADSASVSSSQPVTQPVDSASVSGSQPVTQPANSASVSSSQAVTQSADLALVSSSQPVTQPTDSASVFDSQSVTQLANSASVYSSRPVTQPVGSASVSGSQTVTQPAASASVSGSQPVTQPTDSTLVSGSQPVTQPTDSASVSGSVPVTHPADSASVFSSQPAADLALVSSSQPVTQPASSTQASSSRTATQSLVPYAALLNGGLLRRAWQGAKTCIFCRCHQQQPPPHENSSEGPHLSISVQEHATTEGTEELVVTPPQQQHELQGGAEAEIEEVAETSPQAMLNSGGLQQQRLEEGGVQFVEFLRSRNHRGETCLHEAVRMGHTKLVRLLIEADAKVMNTSISTPTLVQIVDDEGTSPLYLATTLGQKDIVEALTTNTSRDDNYPAASSAGPAGKTALHAAVVVSKELCELLLSWNMSLASRADESGKTPLHYVGSNALTARIILEKDPSSGYCADSEGSLPIHVAASCGRLEVIKVLLKKCTDCDTWCNASGQTFLHVAVDKGHDNIVKHVCKEPRLARILNMGDHNGDTALHLAVQNGKDYIFCRLLGKREVCLNFINKQQYTPLDLAFLSVEKKGYRKVHRQWIRNDLLQTGATFCTCRPDHFSNRRTASVQEYEKEESERLSKSAGLVAAAAVLTVSLSFNVTINVADKNLQAKIPPWGKNAIAVWVTSRSARGKIFADLVYNDVLAMVCAVFAIFCCTLAGFPTSRLEIRFGALILGGLAVFVAAASIIAVFVDGLSLVYPHKDVLNVAQALIFNITLVILYVVFKVTSPLLIISHAVARCRRVGSLAWVLRSLTMRGKSWIPTFHFLFLSVVWGVLGLVAYFTISGYVKSTTHALSSW